MRVGFLNHKLNLRSHGKQHGECETKRMNPADELQLSLRGISIDTVIERLPWLSLKPYVQTILIDFCILFSFNQAKDTFDIYGKKWYPEYFFVTLLTSKFITGFDVFNFFFYFKQGKEFSCIYLIILFTYFCILFSLSQMKFYTSNTRLNYIEVYFAICLFTRSMEFLVQQWNLDKLVFSVFDLFVDLAWKTESIN